MVVGSYGIGDTVRTRKGQGSSQVRPPSKRKIQLPTLPDRTTRQKVTMLYMKLSKGQASASETLEFYNDEQDMHSLPSTKELYNALACHTMVEQVIPRSREAELKATYNGVFVGLDENRIVIGLREELKSLEGLLLLSPNVMGWRKRGLGLRMQRLGCGRRSMVSNSNEGCSSKIKLRRSLRCNALEEMVVMKKHVDLSKV
ncbi:hypothetical protein Tco_0681336 [Tanacetum coccineum]|uniref:Uncharacterized protein n=1 Tax=Tanacetum coccineum TaxID=301880 RepID=A0ABQ4XP03_9ASTR